MLVIPALLGEQVTGPYEGQYKPPLEVVVVSYSFREEKHMEKMRMETVDMTAKNVETIGKLFPNCITETVEGGGTEESH